MDLWLIKMNKLTYPDQLGKGPSNPQITWHFERLLTWILSQITWDLFRQTSDSTFVPNSLRLISADFWLDFDWNYFETCFDLWREPRLFDATSLWLLSNYIRLDLDFDCRPE